MIKNPFSSNQYSLRKATHILHAGYNYHRKNSKKLSTNALATFETDLQQLETAIENKNRQEADSIARKIEKFQTSHLKKSSLSYFLEVVAAVALALTIAVIVRQVWFEPYEIPTGSMRPSFKEQDHLLVSKTTFGINTPLATDHLLFEPELVNRGGVVVWSGDNVDLPDTDSTFLGVFPYKKRYIKRLIGKPGDTIYFYGGLLYGIDKDGHQIADFRDNPWLQKLDHIPFMNFEGRTSVVGTKGGTSEILFSQMNIPTGRILFSNYRDIRGEIFDGKQWIPESLDAHNTSSTMPKTYSDFLGMGNFAMARLLTKEQLLQYSTVDPTVVQQIEEAPLYLELRHHPSMSYPQPRIFADRYGRYNVLLTPLVSVIPLQQHHLDTIMDNMYTARFVVANGQAKRYEVNNNPFTPNDPSMAGIPDGTYEFYYGKASKIRWGGISEELPSSDPLYSHTPAFIQKLFNLGPIMVRAFEPSSKNQTLFPHRYAYFREGDLYLMGAPILNKEDPALIAFNKQEEQRAANASSDQPYIPFKDKGTPDVATITAFGIKIPDKHYMVLGDNYSNSADSREFGFLPEANLQGAPSLIIWPPGARWGTPHQLPYSWLTLPNIIVWSLVVLALLLWWLIHRYHTRKPQFTTKIDGK